jgi:hypothetical protein
VNALVKIDSLLHLEVYVLRNFDGSKTAVSVTEHTSCEIDELYSRIPNRGSARIDTLEVYSRIRDEPQWYVLPQQPGMEPGGSHGLAV